MILLSKQSFNEVSMRDSTVVLHDEQRQAIHFCDTELRGDDRWFSFIGDHDDLHIKVESLMVDNGIAHNVTSVQYLRKCGKTVEYTVVFNRIVNVEANAKSLSDALQKSLPIEVKKFIAESPDSLHVDGEGVPPEVVRLQMNYRESLCECYEDVFNRNIGSVNTNNEFLVIERAEQMLIATLSESVN
jgi:hypothetical protein